MMCAMSQMPPIPPIETATDPVHSTADLRQRWRALMGPLGFGERLLWFGLIGPDRRFIKVLNHIPIGHRPRARFLRDLMSALHTLLNDRVPAYSSVAMLLTGPGRGAVSPADRVWSKQLTALAAQFDVPLEPVFCANDEVLLQVDVPEAS